VLWCEASQVAHITVRNTHPCLAHQIEPTDAMRSGDVFHLICFRPYCLLPFFPSGLQFLLYPQPALNAVPDPPPSCLCTSIIFHSTHIHFFLFPFFPKSVAPLSPFCLQSRLSWYLSSILYLLRFYEKLRDFSRCMAHEDT